MRIFLSEEWKKEVESKAKEGKPIDLTTAITKALTYIVLALTREDRPYRIYNLGAGVKRITTETEICPCCKKKL